MCSSDLWRRPHGSPSPSPHGPGPQGEEKQSRPRRMRRSRQEKTRERTGAKRDPGRALSQSYSHRLTGDTARRHGADPALRAAVPVALRPAEAGFSSWRRLWACQWCVGRWRKRPFRPIAARRTVRDAAPPRTSDREQDREHHARRRVPRHVFRRVLEQACRFAAKIGRASCRERV